MDDVLDDLEARGLIQDTTDRAALAARLAQGPITLYAGFDPTADSLHVGNLVPLLTLRRFQDHGHRPLVLAGGATGMIGDPGGRTSERSLQDDATVGANVEAITGQLTALLDFDAGDRAAVLVDNADWTAPMGVLDFLRDVGKHVTVNQMLAKESIRARVDSEQGISFTEFSYMLLQANDYHWLHQHHGCELQVGGSDQWGNITAGIDLIRRKTGASVHGLTVPLLTAADGSKFGKSQSGAVWLDPRRTSPYQLFQYFMGADDEDVERLLLQLTLLPVDECVQRAADHRADPRSRSGQRALARAFTAMIHGEAAATSADEASTLLFGGDASDLGAEAFATVGTEVPSTLLASDQVVGGSLIDLLWATGVAGSKGDARRTLDQRGIAVNNVKVEGDRPVTTADLLHGRYLLLRKGKGTYHLVEVA